jgi:superfamily II DNA or RNA helicase
MISTLINRLKSIPAPDWIIGDEMHHWAEENMWGKAVRHYQKENPDLKILGLTATPNGLTSGRGLHPFSDYMVDDLTTMYLVNEGWLVYPHLKIGEKIEVPKFHVTGGDYDKKEQTEHFSKKQIVGSAVENYNQYMDGLPVLVSCVSLEHAHYMQQQYEQAAREKKKSWKAVMIQGGKKYERQMFRAIEGMEKGTVQIITFCDVLGEGVDVPYCMGIQELRKTKSLVLYLQFIGRTLRPVWPDWFDQYKSDKEQRLQIIRTGIKPVARVQDFAGNYDEHRHPISDRAWTLSDTRVRGKRGDQMPKPEVSVCPSCGGVWPGMPKVCPDCGFDLQTEREKAQGRKPPEEIEGILRDVLPEGTEEQQVAALINQVMTLQRMDPADRHKEMLHNLMKNGDTARTRAVATAIGYRKNWTRIVYKRLRGHG